MNTMSEIINETTDVNKSLVEMDTIKSSKLLPNEKVELLAKMKSTMRRGKLSPEEIKARNCVNALIYYYRNREVLLEKRKQAYYSKPKIEIVYIEDKNE